MWCISITMMFQVVEIFTQVLASSTHEITFINPQKSLKYCKNTQKSKTVGGIRCLNLSGPV